MHMRWRRHKCHKVCSLQRKCASETLSHAAHAAMTRINAIRCNHTILFSNVCCVLRQPHRWVQRVPDRHAHKWRVLLPAFATLLQLQLRCLWEVSMPKMVQDCYHCLSKTRRITLGQLGVCWPAGNIATHVAAQVSRDVVAQEKTAPHEAVLRAARAVCLPACRLHKRSA
jgi:hypothetical protein